MYFVLVIYSSWYLCRWHSLFSTIGKGYHHPQFGRGCKGFSREPVQELLRPPIPQHHGDVVFSFLIMLLISIITAGVEWVSILLCCLMVINGGCTGTFSTRHFDPMQCTDFCPPNTAGHAISSGSCWISLNNSVIMFSSKCTMAMNMMVDPTQLSIEVHSGNHHEQHVRLRPSIPQGWACRHRGKDIGHYCACFEFPHCHHN